MKKVFVFCLTALSLTGCYEQLPDCPECEECEECPDPIPEPTMWRLFVWNDATTSVRVWIDTDNYLVVLPDGIVDIGEVKFIDYIEEGNHFFYARREVDTGVYWQDTEYVTADYTWWLGE